jgi:hypothetical protein
LKYKSKNEGITIDSGSKPEATGKKDKKRIAINNSVVRPRYGCDETTVRGMKQNMMV